MASMIKCLMLLKIAIRVVSPKTIGTLKPWKCRYFVVLVIKKSNQVASANQQVQRDVITMQQLVKLISYL